MPLAPRAGAFGAGERFAGAAARFGAFLAVAFAGVAFFAAEEMAPPAFFAPLATPRPAERAADAKPLPALAAPRPAVFAAEATARPAFFTAAPAGFAPPRLDDELAAFFGAAFFGVAEPLDFFAPEDGTSAPTTPPITAPTGPAASAPITAPVAAPAAFCVGTLTWMFSDAAASEEDAWGEELVALMISGIEAPAGNGRINSSGRVTERAIARAAGVFAGT